MIGRIIEFSVRNRFVVLVCTAAIALGGLWCLYRTPVDAIPDLSENQVIVWADWPGRSPREVEEQVTYPLSVNLQGLAHVKAVRSTSEFGFSMINVIFDDDVEFYFARQRVLERLSTTGGVLPEGVVPVLAPDATALGQIFWYTIEGEGTSLDELRAIQDWDVRYQLNSIPGVAQVAGVGGFVREYQIDVDPEKLRAYGISLGQLFNAVAASNSSVGGQVIHKGGSEYLVRGTAWIRSLEDVRQVMVAERDGVPITVERLGTVQLGPGSRRSMLEKGGGEAVGGVVMMRYGENPLEITRRVKERIREIQPGLPAGVRIVPFYDRTALIDAATGTLTRTLIEAIVVASLVVILVLWHVRSALVICVTLPLAVLISFIFMYFLEIPSNIMSLSGIAISIGVLVDAGIVMTENAYHRLHDRFGSAPVTGDTRPLVIEACKVVGGPLFFSILIMLLSFAPVFVLGGMEGRMFNPLAYTKSFALVGVAVLAVTLVPALIPTFVRGRLRSQEEVWIVRSFLNIYRPMLEFFLKTPDVLVVITGLLMVVALPLFPRHAPWSFIVLGVPFVLAATTLWAARFWPLCLGLLLFAGVSAWNWLAPLGEEFMPPLDELAVMDMPTTTPNVNITRAGQDLRLRDALLREFPEVHQVVGKVGRADTPTDPAPPDMVETIVSLRPRDQWPRRKVDYTDVVAESEEMARALGVPPTAAAAMEGAQTLDRTLRDLSVRRLRENVPVQGRELIRLLRTELLAFLRVADAPYDAALEEELVARYAARFDEWVQTEDVATAARRLIAHWEERRVIPPNPNLSDPGSPWHDAFEAITGRERPTLFERLRDTLEARHHELRAARVDLLDWELQERAPEALVDGLIAGFGAPAAPAIRDARVAALRPTLQLWRKSKSDLVSEMDSELQVPGWGNIWTQPIINRVDMLATGVRTMVGVKIIGGTLDTVDVTQKVSQQVAEVLKSIRGARDIFPDQIVGENTLEISIDREKAARHGVSVETIQETIEVALGGKQITLTVEGRRRFPVRVRYPRDLREDEEKIRAILVTAGMDGEAMAPRLVPLGLVADVRTQPGPSMIKSENGRLRSYVQLNVRDRDIVGFVEEARAAVETRVALPPGYHIEWSGQFEHTVRAQKTLTIVVPAVLLIIFIILMLTYGDLADSLMMFLAVPGALAGGALFQYLCPILGVTAGPVNFSVAVQVGYIACLGLATETAIVMMVYLREAIDRRGGMEKIATEAEIREAVIDGAIHRLRPKLLTEGTTILALVPMLYAGGVGSEFMSPMAIPIVGGILVADEVIDILIPVLFYKERCRRLRKRLTETCSPAPR